MSRRGASSTTPNSVAACEAKAALRLMEAMLLLATSNDASCVFICRTCWRQVRQKASLRLPVFETLRTWKDQVLGGLFPGLVLSGSCSGLVIRALLLSTVVART